MSIILEIVIALFFAKLLGALFKKIGLVELLGAIVAGFVLGPVLAWIHLENIEPFGHIGLILILFLAGFEEFDLKNILEEKTGITLTGVLGGLIPFALGWGTGLLFGYSNVQSLFIGGMLAATSVSIAVGTLLASGKMGTRVGRYALASSMLDDIVSLFIFIFISGMAATGSLDLVEIGKAILNIAIFAGVSVLFFWLSPRIVKFFTTMHSEEAEFGISMIFILALAFISEYLGLSSVIGAFVAGIVLSKVPGLKSKINLEKFKAVSLGLFVPLFFVWVGAQLEIELSTLGWFMLVVIIVAFVSKILAAFITGKIAKMSNVECWALGIARVPRGEVTLTILILGKSLGVIDNTVFGVMFALVFLTSIVVPIMLKPFLARIKE